MQELLTMFSYDFMQRACIAGILLAYLAPRLGMYLVVRRYALITDTLAHVSFAGIIVGGILGIAAIPSALITTLCGVFGIERLRQGKILPADTTLAILLSASLAIGLTLLSFFPGTITLTSILFGSISTVQTKDIVYIVLLFVGIVGYIELYKNKLFLATFDEDIARVSKIHTHRIGIGLIVITALFVALGVQIVGTLLLGALIVLPVATALIWKKGWKETNTIATIFSITGMIVGIVVSYMFDVPSGGAIVLTLVVFFFLSLAVRYGKKISFATLRQKSIPTTSLH